MKPLEKKEYAFEELQEIASNHIDEILSHYPDLDKNKIDAIGIMESGRLQLKVPDTFKHRQVIMIVGYLKWLLQLE